MGTDPDDGEMQIQNDGMETRWERVVDAENKQDPR